MIRAITGRLGRIFGRFVRARNGGGAIELALTLPIMFGLFMASAESGLYMTREVMLERAVDLTVRKLRLGLLGSDMDHAKLKKAICDNSTFIPNCSANLRLGLFSVSTTTWNLPTGRVECTDVVKPINANPKLNPGASNELMVIRACLLQDPVFPGAQIGQAIARDSTGAGRYALVSTSAFVNEPR